VNQREHDAVKRALAEEFGLTNVDDPDELRLLVRTKMAEMNALDRAALEMRVGRVLSERENGGLPKTHYILLSYAILALLGWFIWRPAAVVIAILASANIRGVAIRHALFWTPSTAIGIGAVYGILLGVLVRFGTALTTHTTTAGVVLGVLGLLAAGYIGDGVPTRHDIQTPGDERRALAQKGALGSYLVAALALFFWHLWGSRA
jgi:hypothetical protein